MATADIGGLSAVTAESPLSLGTTSGTEAADWNAASDWVRSQVVVTFRHRAIASRLSPFPCVANASSEQLDDVVLEIILPENLQHSHANDPASPDSVDQVRARIKQIEEIQNYTQTSNTSPPRRRRRKSFRHLARSRQSSTATTRTTSASRFT